MQTALAEKEEQLQRQRCVIADLEATINAQSCDIRTALQLVSTQCHMSRHAGFLAVVGVYFNLPVAWVLAQEGCPNSVHYEMATQYSYSNWSVYNYLTVVCVCTQVTYKHDKPSFRETQMDDLVPVRHPQSSHCNSVLQQQPVAHHHDSPYRSRPEAHSTQHYIAASHVCCSPSRSQHQHSNSMDVLCKDLQQLDAQIADLDTNLASASHRLHH